MARRLAYKLFQVGQKAFIEDEGKVLVLFRSNGWFDFPGGRIDEGERDLVAALKREVREETSLEIEVGPPFAAWLGRGGRVYLVGYRCRRRAGEIALSSEHVDFRWVDAGTYRELHDGSAPFQALEGFFEGVSPGNELVTKT